MSDIFISYNNKDRAKAELFAQAFERASWSVFWDKAIPPGKTFDQYIGDQLDAAKCVVVLWSAGSVNSDWVKEEAQRGVQRKALVPIFIEKVSPPLGFGRIEAAELFDWEGDTSNAEFQNLVKAIEALIGRGQSNNGAPPASVSVTETNPFVASESRVPSGASPIKMQSAFVGLAALAGLVILFLVLRGSKDETSNKDPKDKRTPDTAARISGGWGVLLGSDKTIEAARDEVTRASRKGIPATGLYLNGGYYATVAVTDNKSTAHEFLVIAKTFRPDAHIVPMDGWCRNPQQRNGYVECQSRP